MQILNSLGTDGAATLWVCWLSKKTVRPFKTGKIKFPETLVKNYQHSLRNNTEDLGSYLGPGGSFKTRNLVKFIINIQRIGHSGIQVVPSSGRSFVQRSPTEWCVSECECLTSQSRLRCSRVVEQYQKWNTRI